MDEEAFEFQWNSRAFLTAATVRVAWTGRGAYKRRGGLRLTSRQLEPGAATASSLTARDEQEVSGLWRELRGIIWSSENLLGLKMVSTQEQSAAEPIPVLFLSGGFYFDTWQISGSDLMR